MQEILYQFDKELFKKCTRKHYSENWEKKIIPVRIWIACGIALMFIPPIIAYFAFKDAVITAALLICCLIFGAIPLSVGMVLYRRVCAKFGAPYECMTKMFLYSDAQGIAYGYHDKYDNKSKVSAKVYTIAYGDIHSVDVHQAAGIISIYGAFQRIDYDDLLAKRVRGRLTSGELGDRGCVSFFLCFDKQQDFFDALKMNGVRVNFL